MPNANKAGNRFNRRAMMRRRKAWFRTGGRRAAPPVGEASFVVHRYTGQQASAVHEGQVEAWVSQDCAWALVGPCYLTYFHVFADCTSFMQPNQIELSWIFGRRVSSIVSYVVVASKYFTEHNRYLCNFEFSWISNASRLAPSSTSTIPKSVSERYLSPRRGSRR